MRLESHGLHPVEGGAILVLATAGIAVSVWRFAPGDSFPWAAVLAAAVWGAAGWILYQAIGRRRIVSGSRRDEVTAPQHYEEFARSLSLIVGVEELLSTAMGRIANLSGADRICVLLAHSSGDPFRPRVARGWSDAELTSVEIDDKARLVRWLHTNESYLLPGANSAVTAHLHPEEREELERFGVEAVWPLVVANRLVGMIWAAAEGGVSADQAARVWAMVPLMALGVENALLYEQQRLRMRRLYRAERLAITGQLAAGAAHEIRNPLASIRSTMQYLEPRLQKDPDAAELISDLFEETDRIDTIVQGMLSFARPPEPKLEDVDLPELLSQALRLVEPTARKSGVDIEFEVPPEAVHLRADGDQLKQVLLNVVMNGIQAMQRGGTLTVSVSGAEGRGGLPGCRVEVLDTGVGIAEKDLDRIFDPFFTTKSEGTGLGLAICHSILQAHGGDIEVSSQPGRGTQVEITL